MLIQKFYSLFIKVTKNVLKTELSISSNQSWTSENDPMQIVPLIATCQIKYLKRSRGDLLHRVHGILDMINPHLHLCTFLHYKSSLLTIFRIFKSNIQPTPSRGETVQSVMALVKNLKYVSKQSDDLLNHYEFTLGTHFSMRKIRSLPF